MYDTLKVKAKVTLYSTENGGRKTPISTGYRPNHVFDYKKNKNDFISTLVGEIEFDCGYIYPGQTEIVTIDFLPIGSIDLFLQKGRIWGLHEGIRKVGEAEVLEIMS